MALKSDTRNKQKKDPQALATFNKYWYRFNTRFLNHDHTVFMNWGYEEDPPMGIPLSESEEPDRSSIQLYHRVASQVDLTGKRVLEVSCGHGGGAAYVMRTMAPASYTGLDLNPVGLDFCRRKHPLPGLDFVEGNAQELPFADQSYDAVINIEASHCYPQFPSFLAEVARVLRPGGHLLYADTRRTERIAQWEEDLAQAPLRVVSKTVITEQVARGLEKMYAPMMFREESFLGASYGFALWRHLHRKLQNNEVSYRLYCFTKE